MVRISDLGRPSRFLYSTFGRAFQCSVCRHGWVGGRRSYEFFLRRFPFGCYGVVVEVAHVVRPPVVHFAGFLRGVVRCFW